MTPDTIRALLVRDLGSLRAQLEDYPDEAALWALPEDTANSAGTLALHVAGNLRHFVGALLGDSGYVRDRDAEFVAVGTLDDLEELTGDLRRRLPGLLDAVRDTATPAMGGAHFEPEWPWTVGAVVLHVVEELFRHAGHVDPTADLIRRETGT